MTTFKHKTMPIEISYSEYAKLSQTEKNDFHIVNQAQNVSVTNNTTNVNAQTTDVLGLGEVAAVAVAVPLVVVGSIFGFFD